MLDSDAVSDDLCAIYAQYPGIQLDRLPTRLQDQEKLRKLAELLQYHLPKSYYSEDIAKFQADIMDSYMGVIISDQYDELELETGIDVQQRTRKSDEQVVLEPSEKLCTLSEIKRFVSSCTADASVRYVNSTVLNFTAQLTQCRKQECSIEQNHINLVKNHKIQTNIEMKRKKTSHCQPTKQEIVFIIGGNLPLQTQLMRMHIKQNMSSCSFSRQSSKLQEEMSEIEQTKLRISLGINKLADSNMSEMYRQFREIIVTGETVCQHFIEKLVQSVRISSTAAINVYAKLLSKLCKIPSVKFGWSVEKSRNKRDLNPFHRVLAREIELQFTTLMQSPNKQSKQLKSIYCLIAFLVMQRKFATKILQDVIERSFTKILSEQHKQVYFEALIMVLTIVQPVIDKIQSKMKLHTNIGREVGHRISQFTNKTISSNVCELLVSLQSNIEFETTKIKCLLRNLIDKAQEKPVQSIGQFKQNLKAKLYNQLRNKQPNTQTLHSLTHNIPNKQLYFVLLQLSYDWKQCEIAHKLSIIKSLMTNDLTTQKMLIEIWNKQYMYFVLQQCDYSFMIDTLTQLFVDYIEKPMSVVLKKIDEGHQYFEDCEYFMGKLQRKLQQHAKAQE